MKPWMLPWIPALGLVGTVVFFTVAGRYAGFALVGIALLLAPVGVAEKPSPGCGALCLGAERHPNECIA